MKFKKQFLSGPYILWVIGFILLPLLFIVYYAFTTKAGSFTLANITAISNKTFLKALGLSLKLSLTCTIICLLLAYPLALILRSMKLKSQGFIVFIFILPMWMNFMLRIMAWQLLLSNNGILNTVLTALGLGGINLLYTEQAVTIGMVYDYLPFMILPVYNALSRINDNIIDAAKDLGANNFKVLTKVTLPLSLPGIFSGIVMVFVPSMTSFVISNVLGGGKVLLIGNVIEQEYMQSMDWNTGSGLSFILMIFVIASMTIMNKFDKSGEGVAVW